MTPVDISPLFQIGVALGIIVLVIAVLYFSLIAGHQQLDLGKEEEMVLYGKNTKPLAGKYWEGYLIPNFYNLP